MTSTGQSGHTPTRPNDLAPDRKCAVIVVLNMLFTGAVVFCFAWGFSHTAGTSWFSGIPTLFLVAEGLVVGPPFVIVILRLILVELAGAPTSLADYPGGKTKLATDLSNGWHKRKQTLVYTPLVLTYTAISIYAYWELVAGTGGGIQSPFAPILAAMAIFGPFFSNNPFVVFLLCFGTGFLIYFAYHSAYIGNTVGSLVGVYQRPYYFVEITMVLVSGLINGFRIWSEARHRSSIA